MGQEVIHSYDDREQLTSTSHLGLITHTYDEAGNRILRVASNSNSGVPIPVTDTATSITQIAATLSAAVNPNGAETTAWIEWGTTTSYGNLTPSQSVGSGTQSVNVATTISGLAPGTTYHFRVVAQNASGIAYGQNEVMMTSAAPVLVLSASSVTVPEGGTASFTARLSTQPLNTATVTVTRISGDADLTVNSGGSLTFTTTNWNTPQIITLAAVEDVDLTNSSAIFELTSSNLAAASMTGTEDDNDMTIVVEPGQVDTTFGVNGFVTTALAGVDERGVGLAVQSDGKYLAMAAGGGSNRATIVRFLPEGTLDTSFGVGGKVETLVELRDWTALVVDSVGRVIACGQIDNGSNTDFAVVRYTSEGLPDITFDGDGMLVTPIGGHNEGAHDLAVQGDDKIVVGGWSWNGANYQFAVVRYTVSGVLDASFDSDGKLIVDMGGDSTGLTMSLQSDGKIILAGIVSVADNEDFAIARFNPDGSLDTSFSGDGKVTMPLRSDDERIYAVAVQHDGKIIAAGFSKDDNGFRDCALVRFLPDGTLDGNFGGTGMVITPVSGDIDYVNCLSLQPDGKIVAVGRVETSVPGSGPDFLLLRYNPDGALDTSFDSDGIVITSIGSGSDNGKKSAILGDGRILVAGTTGNGTVTDLVLARYESGLIPVVQVEQPVGTVLLHALGSVGFGVVVPGNVSTREFTLTNSGWIPLTGIVIGKHGPHEADFEVGSPGATTLIPGASTTFEVAFTPSAGGGHSAALRISSNTSSFDINLTGTGTDVMGPSGGAMTLTPSSSSDPSTPLTVAFTGWTDLSMPLTYSVLVDDIIVSTQGSTASRNITGPATSGTHTIKGRIYDAFGNMVEVLQSFTVNNPQQSWRQIHFGTTGNSGSAADTFDYDKDGLVNLLEWACNLNPTTASTLPADVVRHGAVIEYTYTRSVAALNVGTVFTVEWSDTLLGPNPWGTVGVTEAILSDNGIVQQVKATVPAGTNGRRFVHLKVTGP